MSYSKNRPGRPKGSKNKQQSNFKLGDEESNVTSPNDLILKSDTSDDAYASDYNYTGLEAPENVVLTENQAREIYTNLLTDHGTRFSQMHKIQGQFYGNRPRDPQKLKKEGLEYLSNVNNGHARIHINRYLSSEYNLIHGVSSPVNIRVRLTDKRTDHLISKAMSKAWKQVYTTHPDFYNQLDMMRQDRVLYGIGITTREFDAKLGGTTWVPKAISPDQFMCPLETEITENSLSKFTITYKKSAQELWNVYETLSGKEQEFWDKNSLGYILYRKSTEANAGDPDTTNNWQKQLLDMQTKIRNYSTSTIEYYNDDIELVSLYVKEWDGKWSHTIICEDVSTDRPLFFHNRQYDHLKDFIQVWLFETGFKTYHATRGLGYRIFQPVEVQNRLDNIMIDQAHLASTVFLRSRTGRGKDPKATKITLGAINDIGEAEFVEQLMGANIQASIQVNQYQSQILERNVQFEGHNIEEPDNKYKTLGEAGMAATKDAVITKPQVSFFYRQYDTFLQNTFRLMYTRKDDVYFKEWKEEVLYELKDLKLPPELLEHLFDYPTKDSELNRQGLPRWLQVSATRSTSSGSQVADILATNRMFQLAQFMGTNERYTFLQHATAAYDDHDKVEQYFPDNNRPDVFTDNMQKALIETAILSMGTEIPVSPNDDHREEAPVHLQKCMELVQQWQEGADVVQIDDQMRQLYPHFLSHFMMLSQDPLSKALFESLSAPRGEVENMYRQIQANAANARLAEQQRIEEEQMAMLEQQLRGDPGGVESKKIEVDAILKERQMNLEENRKLRSENIQSMVMTAKAQAEQGLDINKFQQEQARKNAETIAKIKRENLKAAADIQNKMKKDTKEPKK
jgi:hypothetical protein